jgi:hypothetical protein
VWLYRLRLGVIFLVFALSRHGEGGINNIIYPAIVFIAATVRARPGRLSGLSVSHSESVFYGAFVWARRLLNRPKTAVSGPGSSCSPTSSTACCRSASPPTPTSTPPLSRAASELPLRQSGVPLPVWWGAYKLYILEVRG